jgi:quercetin dioxygenase-like cupin family protein
MKTNKPVVMLPDQGKVLNILGADYVVKIPGSATDGAFALVEAVAPVGAAVPPHVHNREEETFYILEGTLEIQCGGRTLMADKGTTVLLPKGVPHAYRNAGDIPARHLVILTPAGFEAFFEEADQLPPSPDELMKLGQKYGLQFVPNV